MERIKILFQTLLISLIYISPGNAQDLKYKEIYPYVSSGRLTEAEPLLKSYLKDDPEDPSANLQLALIYEKRFKSYDPIGQYDAVIRNAENAKTYFLKAGLLIDEREIRRNGDKYYTNLATFDKKGKPEVTYQHVKSVIDSAFIDIDHYLRSVPNVHSNYMNMVKYYRTSYDTYLMLSSNYKDINEMYFQYNNDTEKKLVQIKKDYDSSRYFLKEYLDATEIFPLYNYKQTYKVNKINNYRIDGLEPSPDFKDSVILLWDYGSWSDSVRNNYNTEFKPMIDNLSTVEQPIKANLDLLSDPQKALNSSVKLLNPDWDLIHNLTKYDRASLAAAILIYENCKQRLLFRKLFEQKLSRDTSISISGNAMMVYYSKLFSICQSTDSTLEQLKKRNNDENRKKYSIFLSRYFPEDVDLNKYISGESAFIKKNLKEYAGKIAKLAVKMDHPPADTVAFVMYKKTRIPLVVSDVDSADIKPDTYYTTAVVRSFKNESYVAGFMLPKKSKGSTTAYIAKIDTTQNVGWLKLFTNGGEDTTVIRNRIGAPVIYPYGIAFVLNSYCINADTAVNTLMLVNNSGDHDTARVLSQHGFPRLMTYDENNNSFFVTFKGRKPDIDITENSSLTWSTVSIEQGESGQHQFSFAGNLNNAFSIRKGWLVAGNFTHISDPSFQNSTAGDSTRDTKAFTLILDESGNIKKLKVFNNPVPYYLFTVCKINDDNVNLIGVPGDIPENLIPVLPEHNNLLIHYIFDTDLKVLYYNGDD